MLGEIIKSVRIANYMTKTELTEKSSISTTYLSEIENLKSITYTHIGII